MKTALSFEIELDPTANLDLYQLAASYLEEIGITMKISVASEMMEAVQHSQDYSDPRQSAGFGGGFGEYMLAFMMTGDGAMPNAFGHTDQDYLNKLNAMGAATYHRGAGQAWPEELDQYVPRRSLGYPGGRRPAQLRLHVQPYRRLYRREGLL